MKRWATIWVAAAIAGLCGCATPVTPFQNSGRGLMIVSQDGNRRLEVWRETNRSVLPISTPIEARFAGPERVVVLREVPPPDGFGLPGSEILLFDLASGEAIQVGAAGRHHDAEPSPDGQTLAVNTETGSLGDSDLEIWSLDAAPERLTHRNQSLEEPRWHEDGYSLVASLLMTDPLGEDGTGGSFGGTSFTWPRLHRMGRDLGDPAIIHDGDTAETFIQAGTLALWWDARGLFARQARGLVRCDPDGDGCALVFAPAPERRIVDGISLSDGEALLLTVEARDAFDRVDPDEIVRIDVASGEVLARHRAPEGGAFLEIDWIATPR